MMEAVLVMAHPSFAASAPVFANASISAAVFRGCVSGLPGPRAGNLCCCVLCECQGFFASRTLSSGRDFHEASLCTFKHNNKEKVTCGEKRPAGKGGKEKDKVIGYKI
ncbi:hypothetical protein LJC59_01385 [Desulfovibrio sp. OttesenSCG-928-A18]|nr:hypothetical protein [Desulfovibrio sp. OttesenSCG-928-A18]